ncbi:unnamed protein product [Laminaria digitata]
MTLQSPLEKRANHVSQHWWCGLGLLDSGLMHPFLCPTNPLHILRSLLCSTTPDRHTAFPFCYKSRPTYISLLHALYKTHFNYCAQYCDTEHLLQLLQLFMSSTTPTTTTALLAVLYNPHYYRFVPSCALQHRLQPLPYVLRYTPPATSTPTFICFTTATITFTLLHFVRNPHHALCVPFCLIQAPLKLLQVIVVLLLVFLVILLFFIAVGARAVIVSAVAAVVRSLRCRSGHHLCRCRPWRARRLRSTKVNTPKKATGGHSRKGPNIYMTFLPCSLFSSSGRVWLTWVNLIKLPNLCLGCTLVGL